jgi:hypothetical protein
MFPAKFTAILSTFFAIYYGLGYSYIFFCLLRLRFESYTSTVGVFLTAANFFARDDKKLGPQLG